MTVRESDAAGQIIMPVTATEAERGIEITVLRQMGDNIAAQTRTLEKLSSKVDDVRERVIRLESQKTDEEVSRIQSKLDTALCRIDQLESQRDRDQGSANVWNWLSKNAAWLFAGAAAFIAGLALKGGFFK